MRELSAEPLLSADRMRNPVEQMIEGLAKLAEFVDGRPEVEAAREILRRPVLRPLGHVVYRPERPVRDTPRHPPRKHHTASADEPRSQQDVPRRPGLGMALAQLQNQLRAQHHGGHDRRDQQHGGRHDLGPETVHRSSNPTPLTVRSRTGEPTRSSLRRMRVA